jgi:hypothetical protein
MWQERKLATKEHEKGTKEESGKLATENTEIFEKLKPQILADERGLFNRMDRICRIT